MVHNLDFQKAYDNVDLSFLDYVLERMGFGDHWRNWMCACQPICLCW